MLTQRSLMVDLFDDGKLETLKNMVTKVFIEEVPGSSNGIINCSQINANLPPEIKAKISFFSEMKRERLCRTGLKDFGNNQHHLFLLTTIEADSPYPYEALAGIKLTVIHKDGTLLLEVINYDSILNDNLEYTSEIVSEEYYEGGYTLSDLADRIFEIFFGIINQCVIIDSVNSSEGSVNLTTQELDIWHD